MKRALSRWAAAGLFVSCSLCMAGCSGDSDQPPDDPFECDPGGSPPTGGDDPPGGSFDRRALPFGGTRVLFDLPVDCDPSEDGGGEHEISPLSGPLHSRLSVDVVESLQAVAERGGGLNDDVFAKIGDSHSVGRLFLQCFHPAQDLGGHEHLRPTLELFTNEEASGESSFSRDSLAAVVGIGVAGVMRGDPSLVARELEAVRPRFATVMLGTNDVGRSTYGEYAAQMILVVDELLERGVVPLLSTIPPFGDPERQAVQPAFNGMLFAIAASRSVPIVDLDLALRNLPDWGLRSDGVHLSADWNQGEDGACLFSHGGLSHGVNVRNLLTLEQLDRARRAVLSGEVLDDGLGTPGRGSASDPYLVPRLPFGDGNGAAEDGLLPAGRLPEACEGSAGGPGLVYEVCLAEAARLRALSYVASGAECTVEMRSVPGDECIVFEPSEAAAELSHGYYRVVFRFPEGTAGGDVLFAIVESAELPD